MHVITMACLSQTQKSNFALIIEGQTSPRRVELVAFFSTNAQFGTRFHKQGFYFGTGKVKYLHAILGRPLVNFISHVTLPVPPFGIAHLEDAVYGGDTSWMNVGSCGQGLSK